MGLIRWTGSDEEGKLLVVDSNFQRTLTLNIFCLWCLNVCVRANTKLLTVFFRSRARAREREQARRAERAGGRKRRSEGCGRFFFLPPKALKVNVNDIPLITATKTEGAKILATFLSLVSLDVGIVICRAVDIAELERGRLVTKAKLTLA